MKSLMSLMKVLLDESGSRCCTTVERDWKTITSRVEHEGLSFLTITLPSFGKDFVKSLDQGYVGSDQFGGFHRSGGLPVFLQGFLCLVFDRSSGELLADPSIDSIIAIRQISGLFAKIDLPCTENRRRKAMSEYVRVDQEVRASELVWSRSLATKEFKRSFSMLFGDTVNRLDRELRFGRFDCFMPKHGPGVTADRLVGNQKFNQSVWTLRLESVLPAGEFIIPNWRFRTDLEGITFLEPGRERPVRVISVPKTLETPRIIAIEPTAMQYAQQAVLSAILSTFERDKFLKRLITFEDQTPNQRMALEGSLGGELATVDLSEASDRVSNLLVQELLAPWPDFAEAIDACRSRTAVVDGHGEILLAKYASMGSALTFPIETMVFLAVAFSRFRKANPSLKGDRLKAEALLKLRAYGDDLIMPVSIVREVITDLELLGFKVNKGKTFYTGSFRESCGKDYYAGHDVSIVRLRSVFPTTLRNASEVVAMASFRNQLYFAGYWATCQWLDKYLTKLLRHYPILSPTSPGIGRHSFLDPSLYPGRVRGRYQRPEIRAFVTKSNIPKNEIDGWPALVKCLTTGFNPDVTHLERSGRPHALSIKLRWVPTT